MTRNLAPWRDAGQARKLAGMKIDVVPLPRMLTDEQVRGRVVVVFDVLRATTTIATALANGAREIRVFDSLDAARTAAAAYVGDDKLLCGEIKAKRPPGFDLGNSPGDYTSAVVRDKTIFLSTTNGTRALVAARQGVVLLTGALVNASAVANALATMDRDVTLLCSGTDGQIAPEDLLGAGAVLFALMEQHNPGAQIDALASDALERFRRARHILLDTLLETQGAKNIFAAGLPEDVTFASGFNSNNIVPQCDGSTMIIRKVPG